MTDLGQVYDAIDNGEYSTGLSLCQRLQINYPKEPVLVALKSLALCRLGRHAEALIECDALKKKGVYDEHIIHIMSMVYTASRKRTFYFFFIH